jgi:hypothetical protein
MASGDHHPEQRHLDPYGSGRLPAEVSGPDRRRADRLQRQYAPAPASSGSDQSTVPMIGALSVLALAGIRIAQSVRPSRPR